MFGRPGHFGDHVLAAVQHQQQPTLADVRGEGRQRAQVALQAGGVRDGAAHQRLAGRRRQIHVADVVREVRGAGLRARDGDGGLADAAGADDGHQTALQQSRADEREFALAAHHGRRQRRQRAGVRRRRERCRTHRTPRVRVRQELDAGHERVPLVGGVDDVACAIHAVAQRLAHRDHVEAQAALVDDDVAPHPLDQLLLADDAAGVVNQRDEEVERAPAEPHRRAVAP